MLIWISIQFQTIKLYQMISDDLCVLEGSKEISWIVQGFTNFNFIGESI